MAIAGELSDASKKWNTLSRDVLINRFGTLDAVAQRLKKIASGFYSFPCETEIKDYRIILELLSQGEIRENPENQSLFGNYPKERATAIAFLLPSNAATLKAELEDYKKAQAWELSRKCEVVGLSPKNPTYSMTRFSAREEYLDYYANSSFSTNVQKLINAFQDESELRLSMRLDVLKSLKGAQILVEDDLIQEQVIDIVMSLSTWQFARILVQVNEICENLNLKISGNVIDEKTQEYIGNLPFGIQLKTARLDDQRFRFYIPSRSWIPPFRIRKKNSKIELTIFNILPALLA
ncbi:hypothetical protein GTP46_05775 [Duganella sp. FT135W]|uniref:Uncharacterized protein n=1 Tax=Duganella flavida TaxID=2692175 RepID=A0A6L8KCJ0_9BURK|nr:hypothetical protein [Duganella flavida]MYM22151.1 hypothetical protein [Duganella flavida]